jgi:hypothetical protein
MKQVFLAGPVSSAPFRTPFRTLDFRPTTIGVVVVPGVTVCALAARVWYRTNQVGMKDWLG